MNTHMLKIIEYEKKLLQNRKELQELIRDQDYYDDEMMREKINFLNGELLHMQSQLAYLKAATEMPTVSHQQEEKDTRPLLEKQKPCTSNSDQEVGYNPILGETRSTEILKQKEAKHVEKNDLEKAVGKSLMGIMASVLIFISFILFATLLIPFMNDVAKMCITYVLSFIFLGIGLWKMQKDNENKFYIAITGCGIGALYISLLLSRIYFAVIGDMALYILIALWAIGVCILSRRRNLIFQIIGQMGILVSMFFGYYMCEKYMDNGKFVALVIFYMIASSTFYIAHYSKDFSKSLVNHTFQALNFIILCVTHYEVIGEGIFGITILLLLFMVIHIGLAFYSNMEDSNVSVAVVLCVYVSMALSVFRMLFVQEEIYAIVAYVIYFGVILLFTTKKTKGELGKNISVVIFSVLAISALHLNITWENHGMVPLVIIPFLTFGFLKVNSALKYMGVFVFFTYIYNDEINSMESFLFGGIVVVTAYLLLYKFNQQYSAKFKTMLHIVCTLFLAVVTQRLMHDVVFTKYIEETCAYFVTTIFHVGMQKSCFATNLKTGEKENPAMYNIINTILMITGLSLLSYAHGDFWHIVVIITAVITFVNNSKNLLEKRSTKAGGIYVGIKFTILLVAILASFDAVNYVISVSCFVFAIISIVVGFMRDYKSLRIYGLVLSMISTFKLIMVDIQYDNTLGNALSFFASGILCFAISMIYNKIQGSQGHENHVNMRKDDIEPRENMRK